MFHSEPRHRFFSCLTCQGLFRDPEQFPDRQDEKQRYLFHRNSLEDLGYRTFAEPLLKAVRSGFEKHALGMDYGCGHTPVISEILEQEGFEIDVYDPIFYPEKVFEGKSYDYITCCEVIEHFHHPEQEFDLLQELLRQGGKLICMTAIYSDNMDFGAWYYKNDPTHVFIYRRETLEHIRSEFGFCSLHVQDRLIQFSKD